jgi:hypothetical protein
VGGAAGAMVSLCIAREGRIGFALRCFTDYITVETFLVGKACVTNIRLENRRHPECPVIECSPARPYERQSTASKAQPDVYRVGQRIDYVT